MIRYIIHLIVNNYRSGSRINSFLEAAPAAKVLDIPRAVYLRAYCLCNLQCDHPYCALLHTLHNILAGIVQGNRDFGRSTIPFVIRFIWIRRTRRDGARGSLIKRSPFTRCVLKFRIKSGNKFFSIVARNLRSFENGTPRNTIICQGEAQWFKIRF